MIEKLSHNFYATSIFIKVYEAGNMSAVAKQLFLTQPGVSQHIKSLEELLGVDLFIREKKRIYPTQQAREYYKITKNFLQKVDRELEDSFGDSNLLLKGRFKIGIPIEYGNREVLPQLAKLSIEHTSLRFDIFYGFSAEFYGLLESNKLDLAFMDDYPIEKSKYVSKNISEENLVLCIHHEHFASITKGEKRLADFDLIDYDEDGSILKKWKNPQGYNSRLNFERLKFICANARGVGELILQKAGIGILPEDFYHNWKEKDRVQIISSRDTKTKNIIKMTYLKSRTKDQSFSSFAYALTQCMEDGL
ncbi:LysR family transcriptional regulator [Bacteriovoracaceae bacterium]|nr:LysR family transcriptional regulator [Bacteriovoracaceae bacterium]